MPLSLGPGSTCGSAWLESVLLPPAAEDAHATATEAGEEDLVSFSQQQDISGGGGGGPSALTTAAVERHGRASSSQAGAAAAQSSTSRLRWTFAADVASTHVPLTVRYGAAELFPAHKRFDIDDDGEEVGQQAEGAINADTADGEAPGGAHAATAALAESSAAAGTRNPDQWTVAGIAAQVESWRSSGSRRSKGKGKGKEKAEDEEEDDWAPFHSVPLHLIYEELVQEAGVADEGLAPAIGAAAMIETNGGGAGAGGKDGAQAPKIAAARDQAHPLSRKRLLVYEDAGVGPTLTVAFVGGDTDHLICE